MSAPTQLVFRTIDLDKHFEIDYQFRKETYLASFGHADKHLSEDEYREWLSKRIRDYPQGHVHAWLGEDIIGQVLAMPRTDLSPDNTLEGHVYGYYIAPQWRGQGYGFQLEAYVNDWFRQMGCHRITLSVSPANQTAMAFYTRQGWKDCGPRPGKPVHLMEKFLES